MSDLIRQALGWTQGSWPPDYYALLGLDSGPVSPDQVEAAVLERMEKLRVFQLVHPESVTEAMNLLARALITLSDPAAKSDYDQSLPQHQQSTPDDSAPGLTQEPPPPERIESSVEPIVERIPAPTFDRPPSLPTMPLGLANQAETSPPTRQPTTYERSLAGEWNRPTPSTAPRKVRRRPKTKDHTIVQRVVQLRRLVDAWEQAGHWLAIPELTFATRIEAVETILALRQIARSATSVLGEVGPGTAVINLAQSQPNSTALMDIPETQREILAREWRKGRRLILDEYQRTRQKMRRQSRRFRIRPPWQRTLANWGLMLFALATLLIVVVRSWRGV